MALHPSPPLGARSGAGRDDRRRGPRRPPRCPCRIGQRLSHNRSPAVAHARDLGEYERCPGKPERIRRSLPDSGTWSPRSRSRQGRPCGAASAGPDGPPLTSASPATGWPRGPVSASPASCDETGSADKISRATLFAPAELSPNARKRPRPNVRKRPSAAPPIRDHVARGAPRAPSDPSDDLRSAWNR
jgi:hypothetical protein